MEPLNETNCESSVCLEGKDYIVNVSLVGKVARIEVESLRTSELYLQDIEDNEEVEKISKGELADKIYLPSFFKDSFYSIDGLSLDIVPSNNKLLLKVKQTKKFGNKEYVFEATKVNLSETEVQNNKIRKFEHSLSKLDINRYDGTLKFENTAALQTRFSYFHNDTALSKFDGAGVFDVCTMTGSYKSGVHYLEWKILQAVHIMVGILPIDSPVVMGAPGHSTSEGGHFYYLHNGQRWSLKAAVAYSRPITGGYIGCQLDLNKNTVNWVINGTKAPEVAIDHKEYRFVVLFHTIGDSLEILPQHCYSKV